MREIFQTGRFLSPPARALLPTVEEMPEVSACEPSLKAPPGSWLRDSFIIGQSCFSLSRTMARNRISLRYLGI